MLCSSHHSKQQGRLAQKARAAGSAIEEQQKHRQHSQQSHPAGSFHPAATLTFMTSRRVEGVPSLSMRSSTPSSCGYSMYGDTTQPVEPTT